ncbi:LuxR C-terminal-related transcriptional regulator [Leucobacter rhizosphaerae]|uniref:LuxR C-terminal-related transcriptional regulator n=1 Tax=Leucobacter rhizosphaerae TaxID=2932245 RepID=A0ABY4FX17_9MICO|nr:LuxR C-terminal-related transcriptional regulator [Leucobacter rhizosphaerae]UOQ60846.1 LuxR C-terminal-related transcriptional regulator [Leucobacter rhizosphaerae]
MPADAHFFPVTRHHMLPRPLLLRRVVSQRPALTLIHGPGGSGKSVLAATVARTLASEAGSIDDQAGSALWIELSDADTSPGALWQRVAGAIARAGLVESSSGDPHPGLREMLVSLGRRVVLVLDGAPAGLPLDTQRPLVTMLEEVPDLSVIVTSRRRPAELAGPKTRFRLPVCEFGPDDLALSESEVAQLLAARVPEIRSTEREQAAAHLVRSTRGWMLGVLALIAEGEEAIAGSRGRPAQVVASLIEATITSGTPAEHRLLCATALFEQVSPTVLERMLDVSPTEAQILLERVIDAHFGSWLEENGELWFHHQTMVRDEIMRRAEGLVGADELRTLAGRAAPAFASARPRLAVQAAIIGEQWDVLSELLLQGDIAPVTRDRMPHRLSDVPEHIQEQYPIIGAFALIDEYAFPKGRIARLFSGLRVLASTGLAAASEEPGFPGLSATALRMIVSRLAGNESLSVELAHRLLALLEQFSPEERTDAWIPLQSALRHAAVTFIHADDSLAAEQALAPLLNWPDRLEPKTRAHANSLALWTAAWNGDLITARSRLVRCEQLREPVGWAHSYLGAGYRIGAALLDLEARQPEAAAEHLDALQEHEATIEHWPHLVMLHALITESSGGPGPALERLERELHRRKHRFGVFPSSQSLLESLRARLRWQSGQRIGADRRKRTATLASVYAAMSRGGFDEASLTVGALLHQPAALRSPRIRTELLIIGAESARRAGDTSAATARISGASELLQALHLGLPMRALSAESAGALALLAPGLPVEHSIAAEAHVLVPLSKAEARTLQSIQHSGSIEETATALHLSRETVKWNLKQVHRKLGVRRRSEAIRVAREAGFIHDGSDVDGR